MVSVQGPLVSGFFEVQGWAVHCDAAISDNDLLDAVDALYENIEVVKRLKDSFIAIVDSFVLPTWVSDTVTQ